MTVDLFTTRNFSFVAECWDFARLVLINVDCTLRQRAVLLVRVAVLAAYRHILPVIFFLSSHPRISRMVHILSDRNMDVLRRSRVPSFDLIASDSVAHRSERHIVDLDKVSTTRTGLDQRIVLFEDFSLWSRDIVTRLFVFRHVSSRFRIRARDECERRMKVACGPCGSDGKTSI